MHSQILFNTLPLLLADRSQFKCEVWAFFLLSCEVSRVIFFHYSVLLWILLLLIARIAENVALVSGLSRRYVKVVIVLANDLKFLVFLHNEAISFLFCVRRWHFLRRLVLLLSNPPLEASQSIAKGAEGAQLCRQNVHSTEAGWIDLGKTANSLVTLLDLRVGLR